MRILLCGEKNEYERKKDYFIDDEIVGFIECNSAEEIVKQKCEIESFDKLILLKNSESEKKRIYEKIITASTYIENKFEHCVTLNYSTKYKGCDDNYVLVIMKDLNKELEKKAVIQLSEVMKKRGVQLFLICEENGCYKEELIESDIPIVIQNDLTDNNEWFIKKIKDAKNVWVISDEYINVISEVQRYNINVYWWVSETSALDKNAIIDRDNLKIVLMENNIQKSNNYKADILVPYSQAVDMMRVIIYRGHLNEEKLGHLLEILSKTYKSIGSKFELWISHADNNFLVGNLKFESGKVKIKSFNTDDEKMENYAMADIVICNEGTEVIAEMMNASVLCVTQKSDKLCEYFIDMKNIILYNDGNELQKKLMWIEEHDAEVNGIKKAARECYEEHFSQDNFEKHFLKIKID